jgi:hypothetical protein
MTSEFLTNPASIKSIIHNFVNTLASTIRYRNIKCNSLQAFEDVCGDIDC